jgi:hypothetical protein
MLFVSQRRIGAVRALSDPETGLETRVFCQLSEGLQLWVIGKGLDAGTVLCRCGIDLYYVFPEDLGVTESTLGMLFAYASGSVHSDITSAAV